MKKILVDKLMEFKQNKKQYAWRWDHSFNIKEKGTMYVSYGYAETELPERLKLKLTYLNTDKDLLKNQNIESEVLHDILIPKPNRTGKSELQIPFHIKDGAKVLWKVAFKAETKKEKSYLYFAIGD